MRAKKPPTRQDGADFLDGQLLVAMPDMADSRFARSVIYLCAHSPEGAMGIVLNRPARKVTFSDLLVQLKLVQEEDADGLPQSVGGVRVLKGGPVDAQRGFVLHSPDYRSDDATLEVDEGVSLTATVDVLRAIVDGVGPQRAILALGYAGWSPGQLETEIQNNGWLTCPADPDILFDDDVDAKYARALSKLGVDQANLVGDAGRA